MWMHYGYLCVCTCVYTRVYAYWPKALLFPLFSLLPALLLLTQGAGWAVLGQGSELHLVEH